jgi:hypothetical protein
MTSRTIRRLVGLALLGLLVATAVLLPGTAGAPPEAGVAPIQVRERVDEHPADRAREGRREESRRKAGRHRTGSRAEENDLPRRPAHVLGADRSSPAAAGGPDGRLDGRQSPPPS